MTVVMKSRICVVPLGKLCTSSNENLTYVEMTIKCLAQTAWKVWYFIPTLMYGIRLTILL